MFCKLFDNFFFQTSKYKRSKEYKISINDTYLYNCIQTDIQPQTGFSALLYPILTRSVSFSFIGYSIVEIDPEQRIVEFSKLVRQRLVIFLS